MVRTADFPVCCVADFQIGGASSILRTLANRTARRLEAVRHSRLGSLRYGSRQSHPLPITLLRRSARLARHPVCHHAATVRGCWLGTRGRLRVAQVASGGRVVRGKVAGIGRRAGWRQRRAAPLRVRTANALVFIILLVITIRNANAKAGNGVVLCVIVL